MRSTHHFIAGPHFNNLNIHRLASLYEAFAPEEALRLARKLELELVHTPKHGSWLNMAEPELSVLTRPCLRQRINSICRHPASADFPAQGAE